MQDRLRARLRHAERDWEAVRGGLPDPASRRWSHGRTLATGPTTCVPRSELERQVRHHKALTLGPSTVADAAQETDALGYQFHLFTEKGSGIDSVLVQTQEQGYELLQVPVMTTPNRIGIFGYWPGVAAPHGVERRR